MRPLAKILGIILAIIVYGRLWNAVGLRESGIFNTLIVALLTSFAVFVHELGHAVAVLRVGGRLRTICVLPFEFRVASRRLMLASKSKHADLGGYVHYDIDRIDRLRRQTIVAVAGPAANLLCSVITAIASLQLEEESASATILMAFAVLSAGMAILNMIPFNGSDGDQALRAIRQRSKPKASITEP